MDYLGVKTTGYRHPLDPKQWSRQTWGIVTVIVLLALLFGTGIASLSREDDTPPSASAKP
jgi:choline-glycine betaine transporter